MTYPESRYFPRRCRLSGRQTKLHVKAFTFKFRVRVRVRVTDRIFTSIYHSAKRVHALLSNGGAMETSVPILVNIFRSEDILFMITNNLEKHLRIFLFFYTFLCSYFYKGKPACHERVDHIDTKCAEQTNLPPIKTQVCFKTFTILRLS